jgi:hypothetical protein
MVTFALFAFETTTVAVAVLLARLGTMLPAEEVVVSGMLVPEVVVEFTCRTRLKLAVAFAAKLGSVHVIVPVPPAVTPPQVHPAGGVIDSKTVFGGVVWVKVAVAAADGPLFVTLCV